MRRSRRITISIDGTPTEALTIGAIAAMINRSTVTVVRWENEGVIPRTPYLNRRSDGMSVRLYTLPMVNVIVDAVSKVSTKSRLRPEDVGWLQEKIRNGWLSLGIKL